MDRSDPNTWTQSYVSSNRAECLRFLQETDRLVVKYIRERNYPAAVAGLDRILNGLVALHNGKCGNFRSHIAMFSMCEASVIAFGDLGPGAPESRRRATAMGLFQDAYDFSQSQATKETIAEVISQLKSGAPLTKIKSRYDSDFPQSTINFLTDLHDRLSNVPA